MTTRRATRGKPTPEQPSDLYGHSFTNPFLLTRALTHRSLSSETSPAALTDPTADNEQLEFLGDAVLGMVVAEALYKLFPASREGELTRLRASIVSRKHLGEVAARINLGPHLLLGRGEEQSGGRAKPAILANAIEAVIAALYLDGGIEAARNFIDRHIIQPSLPSLKAALDPESTFSGAVGDHKSALQEHLQATGQGQPKYVLTAQTGPDHQRRFRIEVRVPAPLPDNADHTIALAEAEGPTKKQAQQAAAQQALAHLAHLAKEAARP
ncbi:ribonuclease III [Granulicella sibirica]|uniref:Ribonuclease 3 n=1 Tax=Granulicella sibirica TaxID=2479048 RepID=A0A4Q0SXT0_9BACT|nr:ribonuclease III [Granulicella sibirica]RXH54428.1 Ribonuclease III [Granulicella sibirica]